MPEICRFFGIVILMFPNDHIPAHIHIRYGEFRATVSIQKRIVVGNMPADVIKRVSLWMDSHEGELLTAWEQLQYGKQPGKIQPLEK
jgi:hypothetical protein